tara:strand:+ start:2816 stop:3775 length:960 start_codon:yes stop_codon:yes gene_type:complete
MLLKEFYQSMYGKVITEVDDDQMIKYKDADGESKEMSAKAAKRMKKDHPAKIEYDKLKGDGDGAAEKGVNIFDEPKADEPKADEPKGERPATIHLDYDQADDDLDALRYSGELSDNPGLVSNIGDMVKLIQSGHATDDDIQRANDIRDTIDNIAMTNPDAGLDKVDMALKAVIDSHGEKSSDPEPKEKEEGRFGIPNQDLKDTVLQDLNPDRNADRDELGLPNNEEDWDKEMDEVESLYKKARDYHEDVMRKAADAAFGDDEEEAEYYADKEEEAEKEYNKYKAVRDAYEEKGQELGVWESIRKGSFSVIKENWIKNNL